MRLPFPVTSDVSPLALSWMFAPDDADGVFVERLDGEPGWQVSLAVAEAIRDVVDEEALAADVKVHLQRVPLVREVIHEDREVWIVEGRASGLLLLFAALGVTRRWAPVARRVSP